MRRELKSVPLRAEMLDRFVGRERTLAALREALDRGPRVLSLCGAIGVGKSRLLRAFGDREARLGAGVVIVDRRALSNDLATWWPAIDAAIAPQRRASLSWVLFDAWEHEAASRSQCAELVGQFPDARVLIASRGRWPSEVAAAFELAPLSTEDREGARSEASELLLDRVARATQVTGEALERWLPLAKVLEGNPLLIELVAASASVFDAAQAHARIDAVLQSSVALRSALDEQWARLSESARGALVGAAVFEGGFALDAAEAVMGGANAVAALQELRDASALTSEHRDGTRTFSVSRATRLDVLRRADEGTIQPARARCARYFVDEGERRAAEAEAHRSADSLSWLQRERANVLAAAWWAVAQQDASLAGRAALVLQRARTGRDATEFRSLLDRVLALREQGASVASSLLGELYRARGNTLRLLGQHRASIEDLERAELVADELRDLRARGRARIDMAATRSAAHEIAESERAFLLGLDDARACGDLAYVVTASTFLGYLALDRGQTERARALLDEALRGARACVDPRRQTTCLYCLGLIAHGEAKLDDAEDFYEQAISIATAQKDVGHQGVATLMLGVVALEREDADGAAAHLRFAWETLRSIDPSTAATALAYVAVSLAAQGLASSGRESLEAARELSRDQDNATSKALCDRLESVIEWAEAREAARAAKHQRAERALRSARQRLDARAENEPIDLRIAARVAARWIERDAIAAPSEAALVIALDGSWFSLEGAPRVSLSKHRSAQRVLRALAERRVERPGEGLSHRELIARGWPGQRIVESAAALRLRAVIKLLRKAGLSDALETVPGAYALRTSIAVCLSDERVTRARDETP